MLQRLSKTRLRRNEAKWTEPLIQAGWSLVPNVIIERQQSIGLDSVDLNIILHLVKHWWYAERLPYPAKKTIATAIGISTSAVQRRIASMEKAGFIKRIKRVDPKFGQQTNEYDLSGLIEAAKPYAQEVLEERKKKKIEGRERLKRKRPRLELIVNEKHGNMDKGDR